jgi:4-alpha-glucanotransferase
MHRSSAETLGSSPLATSSPLVHGPAALTAQGRPQRADGPPPGWRRSGMLMHVTSLPGPDGIGDLGGPSRTFVDWLARAGQRLWQVLPLHPPANEAMSPYDASSAFAGNPLLISLDDLSEIGLLPDTLHAIRSSVGVDAQVGPTMVAGRRGGIDPIARVARWKLALVRQAARQLLGLPSGHELMRDYLAFCEREAWWLADHVAFQALREQYPGVPREQWPVEDRVRRLGAHRVRSLDIGATHQHPEAAVQFLFDRQLRALHAYASARDVWLMGDAPIYVGDDSADVWAHPQLFLLDGEHRARVRTGAPPDAMDPRGQVWPMPAYDWAANEAAGWEWWLRRLRREFDAAHVVRIDHFRAFADWWAVPPRAAFSEQGRWEPGPGRAFFDAVGEALGPLELVIEDLGAETEPLRRLRQETGLPQMRVLVQGFDEGGASAHLPTSWTGNEAAYTDTHDYDTVRGWAESAARSAAADDTDRRLEFALRFTGASAPPELPRAAIESVMHSSARYAIVPLQDWLALGSEARMNVPGTADGNWRWLAPAAAFDDQLADELAATAARAGRSSDA